MRNTDNPNRRVQDGLKLPWLCGECEALFSRDETAFATKLFHPWHAGNYRIPYDDWLLKFCVSVSWRVLRYARGRNPDTHYTDAQEALMDDADVRWRAFLRGAEPHPGPFEQHLLRSEEHTSELQSLMRNSYAVVCLKNKKHNTERKI